MGRTFVGNGEPAGRDLGAFSAFHLRWVALALPVPFLARESQVITGEASATQKSGSVRCGFSVAGQLSPRWDKPSGSGRWWEVFRASNTEIESRQTGGGTAIAGLFLIQSLSYVRFDVFTSPPLGWPRRRTGHGEFNLPHGK